MQLSLLEAIIRIRTEMLLENKCCTGFVPSAEMVRNFTTNKVYDATDSELDNPDDMDEIFAALSSVL